MKKRLKDFLIIVFLLLDDILILGVVFLLLWVFHINISLPVIIIISAVFIALIFITCRYLLPAYRRRKFTGADGLIGAKGIVVERLAPEGTVKIANEYWRAIAAEGPIEAGETVEISEIHGLLLSVKAIKQ